MSKTHPKPVWRRLVWLAGLIAAILLTFFAVGLAARRMALSPLTSTMLGDVVLLTVTLLFARLDGDRLGSLGLRGPWKEYDPSLILAFLAIYLVGQTGSAFLLQWLGWLEIGQRPVLKLFETLAGYNGPRGILMALLLAFAAGLTEELLFRGYLITRLERLGMGAVGSILTSALLFGLVHWPGYGLAASLLKAVWWGIPSGIFFWYRRSLGPLVAAHAILDFGLFALIIALMRANMVMS